MQNKFKVIREHYGDKHYFVGDIRTADHSTVAGLLGLCLEVLDEKEPNPKVKDEVDAVIDEGKKSNPDLKNKANKKLKNKADE